MDNDIIFKPLEFPTFTVKNRIFRSNMSGRWDNHLIFCARSRAGAYRAQLCHDRQRYAYSFLA
jgi:hypothetical protein